MDNKLEDIKLSDYAKIIKDNILLCKTNDRKPDVVEEFLRGFAKEIVERCNDNCIEELSGITSEGNISKEERWNKTVWKKAIDKTLTQLI